MQLKENQAENITSSRFGYSKKIKSPIALKRAASALDQPISQQTERKSIENTIPEIVKIQEILIDIFPNDLCEEIQKLKPLLKKYQSYNDQIAACKDCIAKYKTKIGIIFENKNK